MFTDGNQSLTFFNGRFFCLFLRYVYLKGEEGIKCVKVWFKQE